MKKLLHRLKPDATRFSGVGRGFGPAAGLLAGAKGDDWPFWGRFVAESAERKLGGRAEAPPHKLMEDR